MNLEEINKLVSVLSGALEDFKELVKDNQEQRAELAMFRYAKDAFYGNHQSMHAPPKCLRTTTHNLMDSLRVIESERLKAMEALRLEMEEILKSKEPYMDIIEKAFTKTLDKQTKHKTKAKGKKVKKPKKRAAIRARKNPKP